MIRRLLDCESEFGEQSFGEDDRLRAKRQLRTKAGYTTTVEKALRRARAPAPVPAPGGTSDLGVEATLTDRELHVRELKLHSDLVKDF